MKNVSVKKVVKSVRGAKPAKGIKGTKDGAKTVCEAILVAPANPSVPTDDQPLSEAEIQRLDELETLIKGHWAAMANTWREIKGSKLYRRTRDGQRQTWDEYCKRILDQSKQYVDRSIQAADVIHVLKTETKVSVLPDSVSQAAPLSGLKPEEMAAATEAAFEVAKSQGRSVTADDFKREAGKLKPKTPPNKRKSNQQPAAKQEQVPCQKGNGKPTVESPTVPEIHTTNPRWEDAPCVVVSKDERNEGGDDRNRPDEPEKPAETTARQIVVSVPSSWEAATREFLDDLGTKPSVNREAERFVFQMSADAHDADNIMAAIAQRLEHNSPVNIKIILEPIPVATE